MNNTSSETSEEVFDPENHFESPLFIPDTQGFELDKFCVQRIYKNDIEKVLIPRGMIEDRVQKLAADIRNFYKEKPVHLLCMLNGAQRFFSSLYKYMVDYTMCSEFPFGEVRFTCCKCSSYSNTGSSGDVKITGFNIEKIRGENVLIVEDMIDSGLTMSKFMPYLHRYDPKTLAVLFDKRVTKSPEYKLRPNFCGFSVPNEFLIGYNLDYNNHYRDLEMVCVLNDAAKEKYAE